MHTALSTNENNGNDTNATQSCYQKIRLLPLLLFYYEYQNSEIIYTIHILFELRKTKTNVYINYTCGFKIKYVYMFIWNCLTKRRIYIYNDDQDEWCTAIV